MILASRISSYFLDAVDFDPPNVAAQSKVIHDDPQSKPFARKSTVGLNMHSPNMSSTTKVLSTPVVIKAVAATVLCDIASAHALRIKLVQIFIRSKSPSSKAYTVIIIPPLHNFFLGLEGQCVKTVIGPNAHFNYASESLILQEF